MRRKQRDRQDEPGAHALRSVDRNGSDTAAGAGISRPATVVVLATIVMLAAVALVYVVSMITEPHPTLGRTAIRHESPATIEPVHELHPAIERYGEVRQAP